ncbi:MAG: M56 family metallopeptidase [Planctomycetota bacterium]
MSDLLMSPLSVLAVKSTLILAITLAFLLLLGQRSAVIRHRVSLAAVFVLLMTVGIHALGTAYQWRVLPSFAQPSAEIAVGQQDVRPPVIQPRAMHGDTTSRARVDATYHTGTTASNDRVDTVGAAFRVLWVVYLGGVVVVLVRLVAGLLTLRCWRLAASPIDDPGWQQALKQAAEDVGVRRRVVLCTSLYAPTPMTCGLLRTIILIPAGMVEDASQTDRRLILMHELEHARRADWSVQLLSMLAIAFYWFNPLVWLLQKQMKHDAEIVCDRHVVEVDQRPGDYASCLVTVADRVLATKRQNLLFTGMAWDTAFLQLQTRLTMITDENAKKTATGRASQLLAVLLCLALLPIGLVELAHAAPDNQPPAEAEQPANEHEAEEKEEQPQRFFRNMAALMQGFDLTEKQQEAIEAIRQTQLEEIMAYGKEIRERLDAGEELDGQEAIDMTWSITERANHKIYEEVLTKDQRDIVDKRIVERQRREAEIRERRRNGEVIENG